MTTNLHEAGGRIAPREDVKGPVYKIRVMGWEPGSEFAEGSSAKYPVETLKRDVPEAFPAGTRMRANHDGLCESGGDIRRIMGKTLETPWEEKDGMYTNARISPEWAEFMENYADSIGVSISAAGELVMAENEDGDMEIMRDEETGQPVLKRLLSAEESPYNSIDFVEAPGADGRITELVTEAKKTFQDMNVREAATFASAFLENKASGSPADETPNKGSNQMDEATLQRLLAEGQAATVAAVEARIAETLTPAEPASEAPKLSVVAEAIVAAGLTEDGRAAVYEKVDLGVDYTKAIESEKAREDRIRAEVTESLKARDEQNSAGYTVGEGASVKESKGLDAELDEMFSLGGKGAL